MKTLIVEDDFVSRRLLQVILSEYGQCDIAVNGREALIAFELAWQEESPYQLICLDIMMPEMDGQEVLKEIRSIERDLGVAWEDGVKIIMTTALSDQDNIKRAFHEQCEAYLIKPIERRKLLEQLRELRLIG
jgi:two-component system chemotaxis response regulator CheY